MGDLISVVLKWARAREHLKTVENAIEAYGKAGPCTIIPQIEPNTGDKIWRVEGEPRLPPQLLNPFIGDTLYNYRSALDHLAWQLVLEADIRKPDWKTAFPIFDDIPLFDRYSPNKLAGMTEPMKAAIKNLQPCYRRNRYRDAVLWALESLGNIDKHRHFNLILSALDGGLWSGPPMPRRSFRTAFIYSGTVEHGTILARVSREHVDVNFHPAFGIAFDKSGPTSRDVLFGINEVVAGIIETFARDFFGQRLSLPRW